MVVRRHQEERSRAGPVGSLVASTGAVEDLLDDPAMAVAAGLAGVGDRHVVAALEVDPGVQTNFQIESSDQEAGAQQPLGHRHYGDRCD